VQLKVAIACLFMVACSSGSNELREWTSADHAHPPDTQIDPNRVPQKDAPDLTVGELLWMRNCARCHGGAGQGGSQVSISFAAAEWQGSVNDAQIARTIAGGKPPTMPAFADLLTPDQIRELVQQVRKFGTQSE